jgi:hypothetical protein
VRRGHPPLGPAAPAEAPSPAARRRWPIALALLVLVVVWAVAAGLTLLGARDEAEDGRRHLEAAREGLGPRDLVEGDATGRLRAAEAAFARSAERSGSWLLAPLRVAPVAGRQLRSLQALTEVAETTSGVGADSLELVSLVLDERPQSGAGRVQLVAGVGEVAATALGRLQGLDLGPEEALVAPLADARTEIERELERVRETLGDTAEVADGLSSLLQGPRRYLVLAANNAEMRMGSGMFLSIGVLSLRDGELTLEGEGMTPAEDLYLDEAEAVDLAPDLEALWSWTDARREWRDLGLSARFPVTAEQAVRMWEADGGGPVDGVLGLDVLALRALLASTGPIEVDGVPYDEATVVEELLFGQYRDFEGGSVDARREQLGRVADRTVATLQAGGWEAAVLAEELAGAIRGRHVMAWSRHGDEQRAWELAAVAGDLEPESLMVGVVNRGGNKLDQFLEVEADLQVDDGAGRDVTLSVTVRNHTPPDAPAYVAGGFEGSPGGVGEYVGLLSVALPQGATGVVGEDLVLFGPDGGATVLGAPLRVQPGETAVRAFSFSVPAGTDLRLEPSARVPPVRWQVGGQPQVDDTGNPASGAVTLDAPSAAT